jgi:hypothetical protein
MKIPVSKRPVIAGVVLAAALIWLIGDMLEFEFPHTLTIYRASHSSTATGEPASDVIADTLGVPRPTLNWHRCSFCKTFDRELPAGMIRVQVSIVPKDNYIFAFDPRRRVLYPGDDRTQSRFATMPAASKEIQVGAL